MVRYGGRVAAVVAGRPEPFQGGERQSLRDSKDAQIEHADDADQETEPDEMKGLRQRPCPRDRHDDFQ
jgi:hypothetical protein